MKNGYCKSILSRMDIANPFFIPISLYSLSLSLSPSSLLKSIKLRGRSIFDCYQGNIERWR
jgi:hypothetical protein